MSDDRSAERERLRALHYSLSRTERRAPPFTFWDPGRATPTFRAQIRLRSGKHFRPTLGTADENDVRGRMVELCRKLVADGELASDSPPAAVYLGDAGPKLVAFPSPAPGWHGITAATLEVDYQLALELSPARAAVKILVERGAPAWKAGLRTGDYLVSIGDSPVAETSLDEFATLDAPAGREIFARYHRPGRGAARTVDTAVFRLIGRRAGPRGAPRWQRGAEVPFGRVVERGADRACFEAEMAAHRVLPLLAFKILVRLLRYYDGAAGAFPSYRTLARDVGYSRRKVIDNVGRLRWLGIVEVVKRGGRKGNGGETNLFVIHWPAQPR